MTQGLEVRRANGSHAHDVVSVLIRVPADKDYVAVVRSAVAQLSAHLGYSLSEITDLRLAVDEACGLLVGGPGAAHETPGELECQVGIGPQSMRITVFAPAGGHDAPDTEGFGWSILGALVDSIAWASDGTTSCVELEKRRELRAL